MPVSNSIVALVNLDFFVIFTFNAILFYVNRTYNMKFLLIWMLVNILVFAECYFCYASEPEFYYLRNMLGVGLFISRGAASVLNLNCCLILLPVCRLVNSYIHLSLNSINRNLLKYWLYNVQNIHVTMATTIMIASVFHTVGHVLNAVNASSNYSYQYPSINWAFHQYENPFIMLIRSRASGLLMVIFLITMSMFSIPYSRKKDYVLFSTAHYLFLPFIILYLIHPMSKILKQQINLNEHVPGCESKNCTTEPVFIPIPVQSWKWMLPPMGVYFFDLIYRIVTRNRLFFRLKKIKKLPGDVYELTLTGRKNVSISPAQYVLLQCPKISSIEWHPFTVVSFNNEEHTQTDITVLMKACGDWTKCLARYLNTTDVEYQLNNQRNRNDANIIRFLIDGAFFSPLSDMINTKVAFCIANGIGITPFASILTYLSEFRDTSEYPYRIHLIWVVPYVDHLTCIDDLLIDIHNKNWAKNKPDRFNYKLFVTKEKDISGIEKVIKNEMFRNRIFIGRPDWNNILRSWHHLYLNSSYPLYICGSKKLTKNVEQVIAELAKQHITFNVIKEAFT